MPVRRLPAQVHEQRARRRVVRADDARGLARLPPRRVLARLAERRPRVAPQVEERARVAAAVAHLGALGEVVLPAEEEAEAEEPEEPEELDEEAVAAAAAAAEAAAKDAERQKDAEKMFDGENHGQVPDAKARMAMLTAKLMDVRAKSVQFEAEISDVNAALDIEGLEKGFFAAVQLREWRITHVERMKVVARKALADAAKAKGDWKIWEKRTEEREETEEEFWERLQREEEEYGGPNALDVSSQATTCLPPPCCPFVICCGRKYYSCTMHVV